jgi:5-oxopent-3-ene-1,2,5-tricarboxylate decarboxylase/2-hydroxyhepta-2,4-diene-1,7-dioate isomerase
LRFAAGGRVVQGSEYQGSIYGPGGSKYDPSKIHWLPPVSPAKIIGLVLNYADHAGELGLSTSDEPVLFLKPTNTLIGNGGEIVYPTGAKYMHYEGELAVVMGNRPARRVKASDAFSYVTGYTIANEITVRDYITNTFRPPVKAKGFDTFCPLGPCLVTRDEISDVGNLRIETRVNGELRQSGNTKDLIHSIPEIIQYVSEFMTLEPNDVILTGTPRGISPIRPGDRVDVTVEHLGTLSNVVVAET